MPIHAIFCGMGATAIAGAPGPCLSREQMAEVVYMVMSDVGRTRMVPVADEAQEGSRLLEERDA